MQSSRRIAVAARRPGWLFWTLTIALIVVDQVTKAAVRASLNPNESIEFIPGLLRLTYVRNIGAAFGLMPGGRSLFVGTSVCVLLGIAIFMWRRRPDARWLVIALALAAAGAAGNLIDRALMGRVTDFADFAFIDFPVFNVADSAIVIGVGMLIVWVLFGPEPGEETADVDGIATSDSGPEGPAES